MRSLVFAAVAGLCGVMPLQAQEAAPEPPVPEMETVNAARFVLPEPETADPGVAETETADADGVAAEAIDPLIIKVQVLLDRAGVSPGVIDGYMGENVGKALAAYEQIYGFPVDGELDADVFNALSDASSAPVLRRYTISEEDLTGPFTGHIPEDYAEMAEMDRLGYTTPAEMFSERFHMDIDLLTALNPGADFGVAGTEIVVADPGEPNGEAKPDRIEVDRALGSLRVYDASGNLVLAYPASIGSADNQSPSGTHKVEGVAPDPIYYYNPDVNFQQGDNTEALEIPPGPNNPVGTVWIDLSEPTYGIHGTPEPSKIDKVYSHGCVRLANWDAEELAELVAPGLVVAFVN